jgi:hypothetical protein
MVAATTARTGEMKMLNTNTRNELRKILRAPYGGKGATENYLNQIMSEIGYRLPDDYLDFMQETNGYNGEVGAKGYVCIWSAEEIVPTNRANNCHEFIPGLVLFASNEGSEYYAFDMRVSPSKVVMIPMIPLELKEAKEVGSSFIEFLRRLANLEKGYFD